MRAFISYSHKDSWALDRLHVHLAILKREGKISAWYDRDILAGGVIDKEITAELDKCDLFLALVSPDFLASNYCYEREMTAAIARYDAGKTRIVPIIVEPCDWKASPLTQFKAIPRDSKPVTEWTNQNNAFLDIVAELRRLADIEQKPQSRPPAIIEQKGEARRYRVKRDFDEIDISDFRQESFAAMRRYFQAAAAELSDIEGIRARFSSSGDQSFTCSVANKARQRGTAHITVHTRSGRDGLGDIHFSNAENAPQNTANGWFMIEADEYDLFLKGSLGIRAGEKRLTALEAAELIWTDLLERAGISHA